MGLFDAIGLFGFGDKKPKPEVKPKEKKATKPKEPQLSAKEKATKEGEPYVDVISVEIDPNNVQNGAFELDYNEIFVARLIKAGYMKKKDDTDRDIVDRWFTDVCRNVVLELYDQQQADPANRDMPDMRNIHTRDLGNGRTEVS